MSSSQYRQDLLPKTDKIQLQFPSFWLHKTTKLDKFRASLDISEDSTVLKCHHHILCHGVTENCNLCHRRHPTV